MDWVTILVAVGTMLTLLLGIGLFISDRMDKLEVKIYGLKTELSREIAKVKSDLSGEIKNVHTRIDGVEKRLNNIEGWMSKLLQPVIPKKEG